MANEKKYASLNNLQTFKENIDDKFATKTSVNTLSANVDKKLDASRYVVDSVLSATSSNPVQNKVIDAEFEAISTAMEALESEIDDKASASHNHNSAYDAKGSASAVQTNLDSVSDTLDAHTSNADIHFTATERTKLSGIESGAQKNTITGIKGSAESSYRTGNVNITAANIGLGNVNNTSDANKPVSTAQQTAIDTALNSAKSYTDAKTTGLASTSSVNTSIGNHNTSTSAHNDIRDLITGLTTRLNTLADSDDTTLDQMSEIVAYIKSNKDLIDSITTSKVNVSDIVNNLTTNVANKPLSAAQGVAIKGLIDALQKELDEHTHAIGDISGLQSALDSKAASSHGTHVSYSSTAPVMDGTASVGAASTVARSDHKHPTDTSRAAKTDLDSHTSNTTVHITSTERTNWNAAKTHADSAHAPSNAEKNQNAFSNVKVGSTTIAADTTTDTLELVGNNVTITPDATNDKVTVSVADGSTSVKGIVQLTNSTSSTSTTTAATPNSVKSAYDLANTAKTNAATAQTRADNAYALAESKVDSLLDLGITATAAELNYVDGVTSNIQTQLNAKVSTSRTVNGKALSGNITLSASDVGADASGSASAALSSAKSYTDTAVAQKTTVQIITWGADD